MLRSLRSRRGQIVIPAMLMFPTLFLFIYLIYETAKVSREKIRHQFAMDAAAFVEMTNYSDFLNRTAYVNGAFPMRIFNEGYWDFKADCEGKATSGTCSQKSYATLLFNNGAYPYVDGTYIDGSQLPTNQYVGTPGAWKIRYAPKFDAKNQNPPVVDIANVWGDPATKYELFSENDADYYWHPYDLATEIYKLYVQIYSLLGSVEDAQFQVLERLTTGSTKHSFLQKSYWLNTGDPVSDSAMLATSFDTALGVTDFKSVVHAACLQNLDYWGNKKLPAGLQPYVPQMTTPDVAMTPANGVSGVGCGSGGGGGLFQIEYLDPGMYSTITKGLTITMNWTIPSKNFFHVPLDTMMLQKYSGAELHTTIKLDNAGGAANVWPDPTPKFQVRQLP